MQAINPFAILGVDEAASRGEIDEAHRRLVLLHHPDRHAAKSAEEQQNAAEKMAEINYAHGLLTDPDKAAAHKRTIDRLRAAGHEVGRAPRPMPGDVREPEVDEPVDYRRAAPAEFTVRSRKARALWPARQARQRWYRRGR